MVAERSWSLAQDIYAGEPTAVGGANLGVGPCDLLLAACASMTLRMYAKRKGLDVDEIKVQLVHNRIHADDCEACEDQKAAVDRIERVIASKGSLA